MNSLRVRLGLVPASESRRNHTSTGRIHLVRQLFQGKPTRSYVLRGAWSTFASIAVTASNSRPTFRYRFATNVASSDPINSRAVEMWSAVRRATDGALDVAVFPDSVLGGSSALLAQVRSGAVDFAVLSGGIVMSVVPAAGIQGVPFAFETRSQAFAALDGRLGTFIRNEMELRGLVTFPKVLDNGFRQITTSSKPVKTAEDVVGLKIRTPPGKLWVDLFRALKAAPGPLNSNELYAALQTRVFDAEENSYNVIESLKLYEVQRYCSVTNHMWDGYWVLVNPDSWKALPEPIRAIILDHAQRYAELQRTDNAALNERDANRLRDHGMIFNAADIESFKAVLRGVYATWKAEFGATAWSLLRDTVGSVG